MKVPDLTCHMTGHYIRSPASNGTPTHYQWQSMSRASTSFMNLKSLWEQVNSLYHSLHVNEDPVFSNTNKYRQDRSKLNLCQLFVCLFTHSSTQLMQLQDRLLIFTPKPGMHVPQETLATYRKCSVRHCETMIWLKFCQDTCVHCTLIQQHSLVNINFDMVNVCQGYFCVVGSASYCKRSERL